MNRFTLQQLSYLSGLPDKTITFWNKKYNVFQLNGVVDLKSTKFSGEDLQRLLNIATLFHLDKKYALENICSWENDTLQTKIEIELMSNLISKKLNEDVISQLISSCLTYNEIRFNLIIDTALKKLSYKDFYYLIIYPFLIRIYDMFKAADEKPVQFFYMKNLLKRKFYHLIDKEPLMITKQNKVLLFLPKNEFNEIGILFANLMLRQNGYRTFYIGCDQKENTILQAVQDIEPDLILTYLPTTENLSNYIKTFEYLNDYIKKVMILATPSNIVEIKNIKCIKVSSVDEFDHKLEELENKKTELV